MRVPLATALLVTAALVLPPANAVASTQALASYASRCRTSDLAVSLSPMGAATGNLEVNVFLRNVSKDSCFLIGYPRFGLQDPRHRPQPSHLIRGNTFFRQDPGPRRVVLRPGSSAIVNLAWGDNASPGEPTRGQCEPLSAWLVVTPPNERRHLLARLRTVVCGHGTLISTAIATAPAGWQVGY